jgi:hypothetical protein
MFNAIFTSGMISSNLEGLDIQLLVSGAGNPMARKHTESEAGMGFLAV